MTFVAPVYPIAAPRLLAPTDDETRLISELLNYISFKQTTNGIKAAYYEGKQRVRDLGISIPPQLRTLETVVGWPGTTVDVLEERLDLEGFGWADNAPDDRGVGDIARANRLTTEGSLAHLDALIYGVAFIAVGSGSDGEPDPLITVESPTHMTVEYDARARRVSAALSQVWDPTRGRASQVTLYLPDQTVQYVRGTTETWVVVDRDTHNLGRVPVARLVNRPRSGDPYGRSEISRAVRAYTDNGVRTLLGMEVAREFYGAPQRYALGADESAFQDAAGNPKTGWEAYLGRVWAMQPGTAEDGAPMPLQVGQFAAGSMQPYLEQVRLLAQLLAAEAAIPASYLGFVTENPASADAIRQAEARLVKRAERRQAAFGAAWVDAMELALLVRDGEAPAPGLFAHWRDASTPTRAASADAVVKLVGAGILPPQSDVTWEMLGFPETTRQRLAVDAAAGDVFGKLLGELSAGQAPPPDFT